MRTVTATPRASILIESMRDIGYTLETALADVIDNSITARASTIQIFAQSIGDEFKIGILDDGEGMREKELIVAMRPGSRSPLDERTNADLGRFGLGLKTASLSQCRKLTVVSRQDEITSAAVWNLDRVAATDDWVVELPDELNHIQWADRLGARGTLVLWENLDRLVEKNDSEQASSLFARRITDAASHLELVFHRFLSGEPGLNKLDILLNNRRLEPFDPFNSGHPATHREPADPEIIHIGDHQVSFQTFTLPHHRKVSIAQWEKYATPAGYLKSQGFYIYRERRLIIHGTWFGLARQTELTKLTRVRIDVPNGLDAEWKIDVKKASAQPPHLVRERLRRLIEKIGATSKRVYTARGQRLTSDSRLPVWTRVQDKGDVVYQVNPEHPILQSFKSRLPADMAEEFLRVLELTGATLPVEALFADLNGEPEHVRGNQASESTIRRAIETTFLRLRNDGTATEEILELMQYAEPFRSNWKMTEEVIRSLIPGVPVHV